jgi:hypothetical protein
LLCAAPNFSRHSKPAASRVVVRRAGQQGQEAVAHRLLRTRSRNAGLSVALQSKKRPHGSQQMAFAPIRKTAQDKGRYVPRDRWSAWPFGRGGRH